MAQLKGAIVVIQFERIDRFDWTDPKSGTVRPIQKFVGLVESGDGTREWVDIGFPRDPDYRPPNLKPKSYYAMPVLISVDKKRGENRLTIRTDIQPFEAPDIG